MPNTRRRSGRSVSTSACSRAKPATREFWLTIAEAILVLATRARREKMTRRLTSLIAMAAALLATPVNAADLKVISAGAVRGLIAQVIDDYSKQTGQKFDFTIGTTGQLRNIIASGQHADLIIVSAPLMGELEKTGKLTPGSRAELGRVGIGVTVREGAASLDVSTPDALKKALIEARSVAYTNPAE